MKQCRICLKTKEFTDYHKSSTKDGYETRCKNCRKKEAYSAYRENWFEATTKLKKSYCKQHGIPFDLTAEYLKQIWTENCPVFGFNFDRFDKKSDKCPALDRLTPDLGYVQGNVTYISARANRIKYDASIEELKILVNWLEGATTIPKGSTSQAIGDGSAEPLEKG